MITCKKCGLPKTENDFYFVSGSTTKRRATCIACHKTYAHSNEVLERRRDRWEENKEELNVTRRTDEQRAKNREQKRRSRAQTNEYEKNKRKQNPAFRLRKQLSSHINAALKKKDSRKCGSFLKAVSYSMEELKIHLERQFESWMNWCNQGPYKASEWDDNNPLTWTWQVDHIIPHSSLPYTSMDDDNFKKCWALENLRPLSAKQNLLDGNRR